MDNNDIANLILKRSKPNTVNYVGPIKVQNAVNYTKNKISNAKNVYDKMSTTNKFLLLIGILVLLLIIALIFKYYRDQWAKDKFSNQPTFITTIHNAKNIYRYEDPNTGKVTPYIPGYLFNNLYPQNFTFSYWIYIDSKQWEYRYGEWKHIFHRGSAPTGENIVKLNVQSPGFWLAPKENNIKCTISTSRGEESIMLKDVDLNKWINISLVVQNSSITLYKNCKIEQIANINGDVILTKDAAYVNYFGGFGGYMAYLQYFNRALGPSDIADICAEYGEKLDKHQRGLFDKELKMIEYGLGPLVKDKTKDRCNYLEQVKKKKDEANYKKEVIEKYKILCENTPSFSKNDCKKQIEELETIMATSDTKFAKKLNDTIEKNIKPLGKGYQYETLDGKMNVAYLNVNEYKTIIKNE